MKTITKEQWYKMLAVNCNRSKHRFRTNKYGITFCVICGLLSNKGTDTLNEEEKLNILA